ncbi:hypothetical protein HPB51_010328 [Rhipicephalus microplus]|uniref:Acyltransferase 3 domain-containing protein n=1 Tax=Rhipicephalus microplus TaxID=6941 RepID=A0A9J6DG10_RHIMP|nr:hypothetical protein HPB51_010328 [Rhipicephalus microplus]
MRSCALWFLLAVHFDVIVNYGGRVGCQSDALSAVVTTTMVSKRRNNDSTTAAAMTDAIPETTTPAGMPTKKARFLDTAKAFIAEKMASAGSGFARKLLRADISSECSIGILNFMRAMKNLEPWAWRFVGAEFKVTVRNCVTNQDEEISNTQIWILGFLATIAVAIIAGTTFDVFFPRKIQGRHDCLIKCLTTFSLVKNTKYIFRLKRCGKSDTYVYGFVHGLRFFSLFWIVLGHSYGFGLHNSSRLVNAVQYFQHWHTVAVTFGYQAVDTFFFFSGFFLYFKLDKEHGNRIIVSTIVILRRLIRVTIPMFFMIMCMYTLPLVASGPNSKEFYSRFYEEIRDHWWDLLFQVRNWREDFVIPCVIVAMYVYAVCNARKFSFLIRYKQLPPDILLLFGGFRPSQGHGLRLLKVLSSEWHRQARFYKQCLFLSLQGTTNNNRGKKWFDHLDLANAAAEFRWRQMLTELRASLPKKPSPSKEGLHSLGNVSVPENISSVLSRGPKYAVEPRRSRAELLGLVRSISRKVPADCAERKYLDTLNKYYVRPFYHGVCFFSGCMTFLAIQKYGTISTVINQQVFEAVLWCIALFCGLFCLFVRHLWYRSDGRASEPTRMAYAFIDRILWSMCVSWFVFACATCKAGPLSRFLSWEGMLPLSRLSFGVYLLHSPIQTLSYYIARERIFFSHYTLVSSCFSVLIWSYILSYLMFVACDGPTANLEALLLAGHRRARNECKGANTNGKQVEDRQLPMCFENEVAYSSTADSTPVANGYRL